jgi:MOSC domain-containing protein YiiM
MEMASAESQPAVSNRELLGQGWVVSVNTGPGGVPRYPRLEGDQLTKEGFATDKRAFEKHNKPHRAVSLLSVEMLDGFQRDGFRVAPGIMAENVTTYGIDLMAVPAGAQIVFDSGVELMASEMRRPCYQLNPMGDGLEQAAKGRSGVLCSVVVEGLVKPGMGIKVYAPEPA